jgi:hypothetical protein
MTSPEQQRPTQASPSTETHPELHLVSERSATQTTTNTGKSSMIY